MACAPAGYGKTVLLADWARRSGHPVAWLSLDAGDNDPARFWRHAVAALDRARPGIGERVAPLLGPPAPSSFQGLVTALINELAAEEALLVLDDYHVIGSPQVHESLAFLAEHRPAGLRVALASRSDPPLALPRLRARGQLTEIREAELRFTPAEAGELLQHAASALPEASVAALAARTERLAARSQCRAVAGGHEDAATSVAVIFGSHRYILDYLAEEVLERQDSQLRTFLRETSVLERLSGPLCDAVTGREASQALLEAAERAGLFLIPLDELRGWWRYHHLFADLLRARLQEKQPGRVPQLHRNAEATAAFAAQALAESKPEERLPGAAAQRFLAMAEWLRGRLTEAERALASGVTGWREAGHLTTTAVCWYGLAVVRNARGAGGGGRGEGPGLVMSGCRCRDRTELRGAGRDQLPAGRARPRPAARDRGHRAVPPVRPHHPAGRRPGHPGDDPAGHR